MEEKFRHKMQEIVPIASPFLIKKIDTIDFIRGLLSFYTQSSFDLSLNVDYEKILKEPTPPERKKFKQQQTNPIRFLTTAKDCMVFDFLEKNPQICPIATTFFPASKFCSILKPFANSSFISFTLNSECTELLEYALFNIETAKKKKNARVPQAIVQIKSNQTRSDFELDFTKDRYVAKSEFNIRLLSCSTSFAADSQCCYIGQLNSRIQVIPFPMKKFSISPYSIPVQLYPDEDFSLCMIDSKLYAISDDFVLIVNPITNSYASVANHEPLLRPPMCSDNHYVYCYKKKNISIFDPQGLVMTHIHSLRLQTQADIGDCPMMTDGTTIVFFWKDKIYTFSLATGVELSVVDNKIPVKAATMNPFIGKFAFLTDTEVMSSDTHEYLPAWMKGTFFPNNDDSIIESLLICNFHNVPRFTSGEPQFAFSILKKFVMEKNERGIAMILPTLMWMPSLLNQTVTMLDAIFNEVSNEMKNQIVFFYCFASVKGACTSAVFITQNYLMTHHSPFLIYAFPTLFDFTKMNIKPQAANKMMHFVIETWDFFSNRALFFVNTFLKRYIENGDTNEFFIVWESIDHMIKKIVTNVNDILKYPKQLSVFYSSTSMRVWNELLLFLYDHQDSWSAFGEVYVSVLSFSIAPPKTMDTVILGMFHRTFYLLLCMIFTQPKIVPFEKFTVQKLCEKYPSPFDKINTNNDENLVHLLNNMYDYTNDDDYAAVYHKARNFLIINPKNNRYLADQKIDKNSHIYSKGLVEYLNTGLIHNIRILNNEKLLTMFLAKFDYSITELTPHHQLIISLFWKNYETMKQQLMVHPFVKNFIKLIIYPFFLPEEVLLKFEYAPSDLRKYPVELFEYFKNINLTKFKYLTNIERLVNPLTDPIVKKDYSIFTSTLSEPELFKNTMLAYIAIDSGFDLDVSKLTQLFKYLVLYGSPRVVRVALIIADRLMKDCENTVNFVKFCLMIVNEFLTDLKTRFVFTNNYNTVQAIFVIINFVKKCFNKSEMLRSFILANLKVYTLAVLSVINNSIDAIREGVKIQCTLPSLVYISGTVRDCNIKEGNATVLVDGSEMEIDLNRCTDLFTTSETIIDITMIGDIQQILPFLNKQYNEYRTDIFRIAVILEFVKSEKFRKIIVENIDTNFLNNSFTAGYLHAYSFQNYFTNISMASCFDNNFGFSAEKSPNINSSKGVLIANEIPIVFTSAAIHPRSAFEMKLYSPNSSQKSEIIINIYAESDYPSAFLTYNKTVKIGKNETLMIRTVPEQGLFEVGSTLIELSSSISKIYLVFNLSEGATLKYSVNIDPTIITMRNQQTGNSLRIFSQPINFSPPQTRPYCVSKAEESAQEMIYRMNQKISSILIQEDLIDFSIEELIHALILANPYPMESSLTDFAHQIGFESFYDTFLKSVLQIIDFDEFLEAFEEIVDNVELLNTNPSNRSILSVNELDSIKNQNVFVLSQKEFYLTTVKSEATQINRESIIIPHNSFHGTFVDNLIIAKHLLIKSISEGRLKETLKLVKKLDYKPEIFSLLNSESRILMEWYPVQENDIKEIFGNTVDVHQTLAEVTKWKKFYTYELFFAPALLEIDFSPKVIEFAKNCFKEQPQFYDFNSNKLGDYSKPSNDRIDFLSKFNFNVYQVIDKNANVFNNGESTNINKFIFDNDVNKCLFEAFFSKNTKFTCMLLEKIAKMDNDDNNIIVFHSDDADKITNNRKESYIIVGKFENYNLFESCMLRFIQQQAHILFV